MSKVRLPRLPSLPHWVAFPFYLLIAYFLSIGPVAKLYSRGSIPPGATPFIQSFYAPIKWLSINSPPLETAFEWYMEDVWGAAP